MDLLRPRLIISSNDFQVVFVHLVCNSALFLPSCCCPFLFNVAANLICIFLASGQLLLVSSLPKLLQCLCGQNIFLGLVLQMTVSNFSRDISIPKFSATTFAIQIKTRAKLQTSPLGNVKQHKLINRGKKSSNLIRHRTACIRTMNCLPDRRTSAGNRKLSEPDLHSSFHINSNLLMTGHPITIRHNNIQCLPHLSSEGAH